MTDKIFTDNVAKICAHQSASLMFFQASEVKALLGEMTRKLGITLNRDNVRKLIIDEYKLKGTVRSNLTKFWKKIFYIKVI